MQNQNQFNFYFLHIPKTGGTTVMFNMVNNLVNYEIKILEKSIPPFQKDLSKYNYIHSHIGTYPIETIKNLSKATLVRNPVDRSISNFLWIYERLLKFEDKYKNHSNIIESLKYYLFNDEFYTDHKNLQTRFLCNKPSEQVFAGTVEYKDWSKNWFIENKNTSIEFAKKQIDCFNLINTTENLDIFMSDINTFFTNKYNINIKYTKDLTLLKSNVNYIYTTKYLKTFLNTKEISCIIDNNYMDFEIYNYVKEINK